MHSLNTCHQQEADPLPKKEPPSGVFKKQFCKILFFPFFLCNLNSSKKRKGKKRNKKRF